MTVFGIVAIAIFILVIWLAFQPRQGEHAANAPDQYPADPPYPPPPTADNTSHFSEDSSHLSPASPQLDSSSVHPQEQSHLEDQSSSMSDSSSVVPPIVINDDLRQHVQQLVAEGREIAAIKKLRQQGMELNEARQYLDALPIHDLIDDVGQPSELQHQDQVDSEVRRLLALGQKIKAVKYVRTQWGYGLKEAKVYVESLEKTSSSPQNRTEMDLDVRMLLAQNRKIEAIKLVRLQLGYDLKDAKNYVESLGR